MLNPNDDAHRQRLSRAVMWDYSELKKFNRMRDDTIRAYLGVSPFAADWDWTGQSSRYHKSLPKGNLLQMAALDMQIALAYGEPRFRFIARKPELRGFDEKLTMAANRMATLLNLGNTARSVAGDSFFGYGIYKCGVGYLPLAAQSATGMQVGPCVWRVGQGDFIYPIDAPAWDAASYMGDVYSMPLNDAQELYPDRADELSALTDMDRMDQMHVMPRASRFQTAEQKVWLVDIYFPQAKCIATWCVRNDTFASLSDKPLCIRDYDGHWSGLYEIVSHLYTPDELAPVAQAESVKSLHYLFNNVLDLTSEQALNARYHPIYQTGSEKDMLRIWNATDRRPVGVQDPTKFSSFSIPGPDQSQTSYMAALMQLFKQFVPTTDDPQRAPTATQGALERQSTNATVAEARRKFNRGLEQVGYKMAHLLLSDQHISLPNSKPVRPGSKVSLDMTWQPGSMEPRPAKIDDFDLILEPYPQMYRTPQERLGQLTQCTQQLGQLAALKAQGLPLNFNEALDTYADYADLPEIKAWFDEVNPLDQAKQEGAAPTLPRPGVGQYTRTNVSEKTDEGALQANLQNMGDNTTPRMQ